MLWKRKRKGSHDVESLAEAAHMQCPEGHEEGQGLPSRNKSSEAGRGGTRRDDSWQDAACTVARVRVDGRGRG